MKPGIRIGDASVVVRGNHFDDEMIRIEVRRDEANELDTKRCECGHLYALHNSHCCFFCMVEDCPCESG
jgi:hypothetical protein